MRQLDTDFLFFFSTFVRIKITFLASGILTLILFFFWFFTLFFLEMAFPNHSKSVLGLLVCLVNENSLNCASGLVLLCFFVSSSDALFSFYICSHSKAEKFNFSELLLPLTNGFARVTSFLTLSSKSSLRD